MDITAFGDTSPGKLVPISGTDPEQGRWEHYAFLPDPLPLTTPPLSNSTYLTIAKARAELATLDATANRLPNPTLLRLPSLRREAQSTSALEGTYVPLAEVLTADENNPQNPLQQEVLNYITMARAGFAAIDNGYPISIPLLENLQGILMRGSKLEKHSGAVRDRQVVIGTRADAPAGASVAEKAQFIPMPNGPQLTGELRNWQEWTHTDHSAEIDPIAAAAMAHYQFETLHPFRDGNGRIGRYLIVLHLQKWGLLSEPILTVSPWFEAQRNEYYEQLFNVSARGSWDQYIRFFADILSNAARATKNQMLDLVAVQAELKDRLKNNGVRGERPYALVDFSVANPTFTTAEAARELATSYSGTNKIIHQLIELEILNVVDPNAYKRRFYSPSVLSVLARDDTGAQG